MRYHYERPEQFSCEHGVVYVCDHPVYNRCTLYLQDNKGLAVIQQRYDSVNKTTRWGPIDAWLVDDLYNHPKFDLYFKERSGEANNGLYPTVSIRQIMYALRMKPLPKFQWETVFDRRTI